LGDIVPADVELSEHSGTIDADESALTGESLPVTVHPGEVAKSGAIIRKGEVEAYVTATGKNTYIGEAMALVAQSDIHQGRFQVILMTVAKACIVASLIAAILIFSVKIFRVSK
jgi:H+-transporting ATPase